MAAECIHPMVLAYRKTHLYLSTKLAFWEIQLPGCVKRPNRPFSSFWTNLSGHLIFTAPSLWSVNLSGPIFIRHVNFGSDLRGTLTRGGVYSRERP